MSADPPGRGDRTVIRPRPRGRNAPGAGQPVPAAPPTRAPAGRVAPRVAEAAPGAAYDAGADESWALGPSARPAPKPRAAAPPPTPVPAVAAALLDSPKAEQRNLVLQAAGPLLLMLGKLRAGEVRAESSAIMERVGSEIETFETEVTRAGYSADQVQVAKYVLCATADDIVQNMPVDDRRLWSQYSMLSQFFNERIGGVRLFDELARMKTDPAVNIDILELVHACLSLGFEGVYRTAPGGAVKLQAVQRDLYETIKRVRPNDALELSPRWRGESIGTTARKRRVPFWAVLSLVGLLLLLVYAGLRYLLAAEAGEVADRLLALHSNDPFTINRPVTVEPFVPPAPPPTPQIERIRALLQDDLANGTIEIEQTASDILIRVGNAALFDAGRATVQDSFVAVADRIAAMLDGERGRVLIVGHTDNVPINTVRFPSNYELSLARADAVAKLFAEKLAAPERIEVKGKGEDHPVADNATAEGRALNRRVEMLIPREG